MPAKATTSEGVIRGNEDSERARDPRGNASPSQYARFTPLNSQGSKDSQMRALIRQDA